MENVSSTLHNKKIESVPAAEITSYQIIRSSLFTIFWEHFCANKETNRFSTLLPKKKVFVQPKSSLVSVLLLSILFFLFSILFSVLFFVFCFVFLFSVLFFPECTKCTCG